MEKEHIHIQALENNRKHHNNLEGLVDFEA